MSIKNYERIGTMFILNIPVTLFLNFYPLLFHEECLSHSVSTDVGLFTLSVFQPWVTKVYYYIALKPDVTTQL